MFYKQFSLIAIFFLFTNSVISQQAEAYKVTRTDLPGMEEVRLATYGESSLWGYINGGADLYLEYGFAELLSQDIVWESEPFKIDVYLMNSPESAFGIFSVSRYSCKQSGKVGAFDCINPYQVQVAHGNLYLSIMAHNGTDKSMELATKIAQAIVKKHKAKPVSFPSLAQNESIAISSSKVKLIKGMLGLQNAYTSLESTFNEIVDFNVWIQPVVIDGLSVDVVTASFQRAEDFDAVLARANAKGLPNKKISSTKLVILRGEGVMQTEDLFKQIL